MTDFMPPIDDDAPELMPRGDGDGQMVPTETRIGDVVSMRRAAVLMPRQPREVRRLISESAEMFGDGWEYRFPVKNNKTGKTEWIEGPTIGCTMAVARAYGNNDVAHTRTEDEGNAWILYSTFLDLQSGFSLTRGFRQRKGQSRMGADRSRGEDIDFQIGVSKSTRNVVARALDDYVQFARQAARSRLAGSIAKRPAEYRERITAYLDEIDYPLAAIEAALASTIAAWTAEQIATVVRTLTAYKDGILGDLDDVYRPRSATVEAMPQDMSATDRRSGKSSPDASRPSQEAQGEPVRKPRPSPSKTVAAEASDERGPDARPSDKATDDAGDAGTAETGRVVSVLGHPYKRLGSALKAIAQAIAAEPVRVIQRHEAELRHALAVCRDDGRQGVDDLIANLDQICSASTTEQDDHAEPEFSPEECEAFLAGIRKRMAGIQTISHVDTYRPRWLREADPYGLDVVKEVSAMFDEREREIQRG